MGALARVHPCKYVPIHALSCACVRAYTYAYMERERACLFSMFASVNVPRLMLCVWAFVCVFDSRPWLELAETVIKVEFPSFDVLTFA